MISLAEKRLYLYRAGRELSMLLAWLSLSPAALAETGVPAPQVAIHYPAPATMREAHYRAACKDAAAEFSRHGSLVIAPDLAAAQDGHLILIRPDAAQAKKFARQNPALKISVIDAGREAEALASMRSVRFRDEEGAFLVGVIAALTSATGTVGFIGAANNAFEHNLAYGFYQGAKYADPHVRVLSEMATPKTAPLTIFERQSLNGADEFFVTGTRQLEEIHAAAVRHNNKLLLLDADADFLHRPLVVTSLNRKLELALRDELRAIEQRRWQAGVHEVGIRDGHLDYALSPENKSMLPREIIDKVEKAKDLVIRGVIDVKPHTPHGAK